jgi:hypothetical protein
MKLPLALSGPSRGLNTETPPIDLQTSSTITPATSWLLKFEERKMYNKGLASGVHSKQGGAHAPHRAKLIQHMMMGSNWIQQQALSKSQIV